MKEVHFIAQGKGGVGKSTIAAFTADYLKNAAAAAMPVPMFCFDTDPVNQTFLRHQAFKPELVKIMTEHNTINSRNFDGLVEKLVFEEGIAIVDNGAATFVPLMSYMAENSIPELLAENNVRMVIHVPLTGGQALNDCITGLVQILKSLKAEVVVWLNDFRGNVEQEKPFDQFKVYKEFKDQIIGIVHIPNRNPDTFGKDLEEMTSKNLSLSEAITSDTFGLMPRQRLKTVQRDLWQQLDKIPFLATQQADGSE